MEVKMYLFGINGIKKNYPPQKNKNQLGYKNDGWTLPGVHMGTVQHGPESRPDVAQSLCRVEGRQQAGEDVF